MATDRLGLYNVALAAIGERSLSSLTEDGEPRRELDAIWSRGNGALRYFLEQGSWNFAMRAQELSASSSVEPAFGFTYAFAVPSDLVRLNMISAGDRFTLPLTDYEIEAGYIFAEVDPLYVRFVSDDSSYGGDFSAWPETFTLWAGYWMATQIAPRLKADTDMERLERRTRQLLDDARAKDAQQEPTRFPPRGRWANSRLGRWGSRRDGGRRGSLIG